MPGTASPAGRFVCNIMSCFKALAGTAPRGPSHGQIKHFTMLSRHSVCTSNLAHYPMLCQTSLIRPCHKVIPGNPGLIRTHSELIRRESSFREKGNHALSQKDLGPGGKKRVCVRLAQPDRAPRR